MTYGSEAVVQLDLPATYKYLNVLSGCIAEIMHHVEGSDELATTIYNLQLAAHEICTNIIGHAYQDTPGGRIQIDLFLDEHKRQIVIDIRDHGCRFDVSLLSEPPLDEPRIHGYGLFLVRSLMDDVTYTPHAHSNHWRLTKRF